MLNGFVIANSPDSLWRVEAPADKYIDSKCRPALPKLRKDYRNTHFRQENLICWYIDLNEDNIKFGKENGYFSLILEAPTDTKKGRILRTEIQ